MNCVSRNRSLERYERLLKAGQHVSQRNRTRRNSSETDLRTRCRGRCRGVSRDSVYIVLRNRETLARRTDRPSDRPFTRFIGCSTGRRREKRRPDPLRNSRASLLSVDRGVRGATQIRRALFQKGVDRNKYLSSIYPGCPRCCSSVRSVSWVHYM